MRHEDAFGKVGSDPGECFSHVLETSRYLVVPKKPLDTVTVGLRARTHARMVDWWRALRRREPRVADHRIACAGRGR